MNTVYICTQGTSVANGCAKLRALQSEPGKWGEEDRALETEARARLDELRKAGRLADASAELSVLSRRPIAKGDRIVLLCTDGGLGSLCARLVKETAVELFGLAESDVEIRRVVDLQVQDAARLQDYGLKNFIEETRRAIDEHRGLYEICLCPNGGFKGVVPFLSILGMLYHCSVFYTFEGANNLVTLPPLPFAFDAKAYMRATRALASLSEKVEMREEEYLGSVENYQDSERDLFLGFVQYTRPGWVTPSSLVSSLVEGSVVKDAWLSKKALEDLEREKKGKDYWKWCRFILNSQDPIWLKGHLHSLNESAFLSVKRTGKSTERLLGCMRHGRFYIIRAVQHDAYESAMWQGKPEDFKDSDFMLWQKPQELDDVGDQLATDDELRERNDLLKYENEELSRQLEAQERKMSEEAETVHLLASRDREIEGLKAELLRVAQENERLKAEAAKPWYRRLFFR